MSVATTRRTDAYAPSEPSILWTRDKPTSGARGVIVAHGYGAGADDYLVTYRAAPFEFARAGFTALTADFGGPGTFGNDAEVAAMDAAITYLLAQPSVAATKVALYGGSMGCISALNYAKAHPSRVASIVLVLPAVSLVDLHDSRYLDPPTNAQPVGPLVEAAYGGAAGYAAALPAHDPNQNRAAFTGFPIQMHYSTNDAVAIPSIALDFAAAVGAEVHSLGPMGHSATNQDYDVIRNFLAAH